jgi:toxin ParE1/3/4
VPDRALVVHRRAEDDMVEIADWIATDNPAAAERFEAEFQRTCRLLVEYPQIGPARRFRARELRGLRSRPLTGFETWIVFYRVTSSAVEVARVIHGARDLRRALRS